MNSLPANAFHTKWFCVSQRNTSASCFPSFSRFHFSMCGVFLYFSLSLCPALQINFNLTHFQRSYFIMPFGLIQYSNARSPLLRDPLNVFRIYDTTFTMKTFMMFLFFTFVRSFARLFDQEPARND